jgi:hypothetical protein
VAQGGSQQVANRHCRGIRLLSPGFKPDQVALANRQYLQDERPHVRYCGGLQLAR